MDTMTIFLVSGMTCGSCVRHIRDALKACRGVRDVDVRMRDGEVHVLHNRELVSTTSIAQALTLKGYAARPIQPGE